jgi:hypothetical protein
MQNIVFGLLLIGLNFTLFLLLNVNFKINFKASKKQLIMFLIPVLAVIVVFLMLEPERYRQSFYLSAALFVIMGLRFIIYKLLSLPSENDSKGNRIIRNFFDTVLFPFFLIFISFAQCMSLFVWNT